MKAIRYVAVVVIALTLFVVSGTVISDNYESKHPKAQVQTQPAEHPPTRAELLALVNAERAKNGVAPLVEDSRLDTSAQMKADDEVKYDYFGHISPANSPYSGQQGYKLVDTTGLSCIYESENITENTHINNSASAVNAWILSAPHHSAMVDTKYDITGFGINGTQIVEHFCQTH